MHSGESGVNAEICANGLFAVHDPTNLGREQWTLVWMRFWPASVSPVKNRSCVYAYGYRSLFGTQLLMWTKQCHLVQGEIKVTCYGCSLPIPLLAFVGTLQNQSGKFLTALSAKDADALSLQHDLNVFSELWQM